MDTLHGAESEDTLRTFIRKQLAGSTDTLLLNALSTHAQADDLLQALPPEVRGELPELRQLAAHVSILRTAREAPPATELEQAIAANPDNLEARYQLCAVHLVANDYDAAMQQLLEIARRDRGFHHDAGRAGLHAVFELLGDDDERVLRYRALLQAGMH